MHQSLYRTYRPQKFSEIAGQDHITDTLSQEIRAKKIGHAYLFSGSRGLGKTTVARIFAREIGCSNNDLYEIDAASHTQVDHMRELIEGVYTLPFESPYKVYILDEAHMLSKGAWNALLKTLEEPPSHVVFILATTERSKVPDTVLSRCQVFEFKKPTRTGLIKLITSVAKSEGYALGQGVADLVAFLSEGSYRDALSTLEKVFSVSKDKNISREEAEKVTGAPRHEFIQNLVEALSKGDTNKALLTVQKAQAQDIDIPLYLSIVLEYMRQVLLVRYAPELHCALQEELGEEYGNVKRIAEDTESKLSHETLRVFLDASARIRFSPIPALALELAVLELLSQNK
jgi:DNA polymerase-3 subunit gamma/tau